MEKFSRVTVSLPPKVKTSDFRLNSKVTLEDNGRDGSPGLLLEGFEGATGDLAIVLFQSSEGVHREANVGVVLVILVG